MITAISDLWSFITVFFNSALFSNDLFLAMLVLMSIFGMIYIFMWFFEPSTWRW